MLAFSLVVVFRLWPLPAGESRPFGPTVNADKFGRGMHSLPAVVSSTLCFEMDLALPGHTSSEDAAPIWS